MRTDDLICMMAKTPPSCRKKRNVAMLVMIALLFAAFLVTVNVGVGFRPDLANLFHEAQLVLKYTFLTALAAAAGYAWWRSGHPCHCCKLPTRLLLGLGTALLVMAFIFAVQVGPDVLVTSVFDRSAFFCVGFIALFAVIGSFALLRIGRDLAPVDCSYHARMTAVFAASLGALAYAFHCNHDNAAYGALWYGGTILLMSALLTPVLVKKQSW